jgi:hypothetical protein
VAAAGRAFEGVFRKLKLPVGVELDGLELEGTVLLPPTAGYSAAKVAVAVSGGGLGAGEDGNFPFHLSVAGADAGAPVSGIEIDGSLRAAMDTQRTFSELAVKADATAVGPRVSAEALLKGDFEVEKSPAGETYAADLTGVSKSLVTLRGDFSYGTGRLAGSWKIDLCDDDLAPFSLGKPLPTFIAQSEGRFETDGTFASIKASGQAMAMADRLAAIWPAQPNLGAIKFTAAFDAAIHGRALRVDRLTLALDGAHPILSARALQAFEFDAGSGELKVADPARELLDVNLRGVPLAWLEPYLRDFKLEGGELHGEILAGARDGGLVFRPKLPFTIEGLAVAKAGRPLFGECDVLLSASGYYAPAGWEATVSPFIARDRDGNFMELELMLGRLAGPNQPLKVTGRLDGNLPAMLAQTQIAGLGALKNGGIDCKFSASLAATRSIQARLECTNLTMGSLKVPPRVGFDVRIESDPEGKTAFSIPILLQSADHKSDLILSGTADRSGANLTIDGQLSADSADLNDVALVVSGVCMPFSSPKGPYFSGLGGSLALHLKKLVAPHFEASDVGGVLRLNPGAIRLDGLRASFGDGSKAGLDGELSFDAASALPYSLDANLTVSDLDSASLFRALDPERPPAVEGKFAISGRLVGRASDLSALPQAAQGDMKLTSKAGIFRLFAAEAPTAPPVPGKPGAFESLIGEVTGAVAAVTGRKEAGEAAGAKIRSIADLAATVSAIHYDQISLSISRDASRDTFLREFTLISPEIRLEGTGRTTYQEDTPFLQQPLAMQFKLWARGSAADLLKSAGALDSDKDELGYAACNVPLHIGGTLEHPDASEIREALIKAAYAHGGDLLDRLLGIK